MATVTLTLSAGSVASPYIYDVNITKQLCAKTCSSTPPIFAPVYTLVSSTLVGTNTYELVINVQGIITYIPCGKSQCCSKSQVVNENFVVPLYSTTEPTVTLASTNLGNKVVTTGCSKCGNTMVNDSLLSIST